MPGESSAPDQPKPAEMVEVAALPATKPSGVDRRLTQGESLANNAGKAAEMIQVAKPSIADRRPTHATVDSRLEETYAAETARQPPSDHAVSPEINANLISKNTWHYLNPLMLTGRKRPLEMSDMYPLLPEFEGKLLFDQFAGNWDKELVYADNVCRGMAPAAKAMLAGGASKSARRGSFATASDGAPIPLLGGPNKPLPPPPGSKEKPKTPSLLRAIYVTFGRAWLWSGFLRIFSDAATVLSPLVLQQLTAFVANRAGYPSWYGYVMAFVLFVMQLLITFFMNASFDLGMKVGFSVRSILISSVYRKTLLLSQASRSEHSAGKITSLMSTDATRVDMAIAMLHFIWSAPITIIVAMALLIINLGASALVGLALLLVAFPLQGYLMKYLMGVRMKATKITDQRVKITQEAIQGVRVIKYQGWEEAIIERIEGLRTDELKYVRIMLNARAYLSAIMQVQPVFAAILTFVVFGAVGGTLTPQIVFPSLALFNVIRLPLMFLPMVLTQAADASISLSRIQAVLLAPELQERTTVDTSYRTEPYYPPSTSSTGNVSEPILDGDNWAIRIRDASFEWEAPPKTEEKQVKPKSSFVARFSSTFKKKDMGTPASKTGFGMSTMAGAKDTVTKKNVQGAMMDGTVRNMPVPIVPDVEATSPVVPKVQLRNVTFIAPRGSLTCVVGPVGSGKSSLLSAMVGEMKRLEGVVQIRGDVAYCPQSAWVLNANVRDNILFGKDWDPAKYYDTIRCCAMERDLEILADGDFTEIGERGITLSGGQKQRVSIARAVYYGAETVILDDPLSAVDAHVGRHIFDECIMGTLANKTRILATHQLHVLPKADWVICVKDGEIVQQGPYLELLKDESGYLYQMINDYGAQGQKDETSSTDGSDTANEDGSGSKKKPAKSGDAKRKKGTAGRPTRLMTSEERDTGAVSFQVYKGYFVKAGGIWTMIVLVLLLALTQMARIGTDVWLGYWSSKTFPFSEGTYMGVYVVWGTFQGLFTLATGFMFAFIGIAASSSLHNGTLRAVLGSPAAFFDTTPVGRIINRFSKDIDAVDNVLPETMRMFTSTLSLTIATFILIAVVFPYFLAVMAVAIPIYWFAQDIYRATSREVARLNSITRSPIYALFGETLNGLSTIRAYGAMNTFEGDLMRRLDTNQRAYYISIVIQRWIALRLEVTSAFLVFASSMFAVSVNASGVPPGLLSLAVTYSLQVTGVFNWCVRQAAETENQMNSVERLLYYANLPSQGPAVIPDHRAPSDWPNSGKIEMNKLEMRYREDLPLVLKGINLTFKPGEKVGIVGRTGAGKSSIMQALFRLVEPSSGSIVIDGIDTSTIGLADLRSRLAIIPQDPVLFSGTVRYNLDPFDQYDDSSLWDCLGRCGDLGSFISSQAEKLEYPVAENGENFSVGQRQLLCLARAMLRDSRICVMDEATASVDMATDDLIQQTIRTDDRFKGRTVLTIAHRLNTIIEGYDRIVVMSAGEVVEEGSPAELVQREDGVFLSMVQETGRANAAALIHMALRNASSAEMEMVHHHAIPVPGDEEGGQESGGEEEAAEEKAAEAVSAVSPPES